MLLVYLLMALWLIRMAWLWVSTTLVSIFLLIHIYVYTDALFYAYYAALMLLTLA